MKVCAKRVTGLTETLRDFLKSETENDFSIYHQEGEIRVSATNTQSSASLIPAQANPDSQLPEAIDSDEEKVQNEMSKLSEKQKKELEALKELEKTLEA